MVCSRHFPSLLKDPEAERICESLDYDFESKMKKMESAAGLFGAMEVAQRHYDLICEVRDYISDHPSASVVNMGSGALIAREVSDITISSDSLLELIWLKDLSDALMVRIQRNYRFVIGFNGALILLGVLGLVPPAASALLHNSSTLLLSLNCMTALKERNVQNGKS